MLGQNLVMLCLVQALYNLCFMRTTQNLTGEKLTNFSNLSKFYYSNFSSNSCLHASLLQFIKILLVKFILIPNSSKFSTVKILRHTTH